MDSRAMVSMNYKAMRFNGLLNNAFNGFQSWDSEDFKTMASRDGFKNYCFNKFYNNGFTRFQSINGQILELWVQLIEFKTMDHMDHIQWFQWMDSKIMISMDFRAITSMDGFQNNGFNGWILVRLNKFIKTCTIFFKCCCMQPYWEARKAIIFLKKLLSFFLMISIEYHMNICKEKDKHNFYTM